jgi:hypothetical protein
MEHAHRFNSTIENRSQTIVFQFNIDQRLFHRQYIALRLLYPLSQTNLSLTFEHCPQRTLRINLEPNLRRHSNILLHLYANTSETHLHLLVHLFQWINFNLTLPKSYPETGLLHTALFMDNEEYFDGYLDTSTWRLRSKDYRLNLSMSHIRLEQRITDRLLASIITQWFKRNSLTGLITFVYPNEFVRVSISVKDDEQHCRTFSVHYSCMNRNPCRSIASHG